MDSVEQTMKKYDATISDFAKKVKNDKSLGYTISDEFNKLCEQYSGIKDADSSLQSLKESIRLKYSAFPDISLNVFYGGLMGTLLEFTGICGIANGMINSDPAYIIGGLAALSLGLSIQGKRISANYNHAKNLNKCLDKAINLDQ